MLPHPRTNRLHLPQPLGGQPILIPNTSVIIFTMKKRIKLHGKTLSTILAIIIIMTRLPPVAKVQLNKGSRGADGLMTVVAKVAMVVVANRTAVIDLVETLGTRVGVNTPPTHRGSSSSNNNKKVVQMSTFQGVEVDALRRTTPESFISPP